MATLKYRLNRKNASGTYDTIHYETSSNIVMRPSGRTVEQDLADFLPRSQDTDDVPQSLTKGKLTCTNSRIFAQTNSVVELARMSDVTSEASTRASADTNLQNQVNSLNSSVSNGKTQVANAITGKGVAASGSDSFATLASKINQIKSVPATAAYDTGLIRYSGKESTSFPAEDDWFTFSYRADGKYSGTDATKKPAKTFSLGTYTFLHIYFEGFCVQSYYGNGWRLSAYALASAFNGGFVVSHYYDNHYDWHSTQTSGLSLFDNIDNIGSFSISANAITIDIPMFSYTPNSTFEYRVAYWVA